MVPTPEVAWWSSTQGAPAAMVSASHNPFADNGIKLFSAGGRKLPDDVEERLEAELARLTGGVVSAGAPEEPGADLPAGADVGRIVPATSDGAHAGYAAAVAASIEGRRLAGLTAVVDCANGSASAVAPQVLRDLGLDLHVIHDRPDGTNINDGCGSTHLDGLAKAVVDRRADLGIAFDGDADRVLMVDAAGDLVDGDQIIALCAVDRHRRGALAGGAVAVTVMTNLGFRLAMDEPGHRGRRDRGRRPLRPRGARGPGPGARRRAERPRDLPRPRHHRRRPADRRAGARRPGAGRASAGRGRRRHAPPAAGAAQRADGRRDPDIVERLAPDIAAVEARLGGRGRVLVRPSGTEPVVRVMVEAPTGDEAEAAVADLVLAVEQLAG